jgi:dihydroorotate dehydrogenase electron transfer subunit
MLDFVGPLGRMFEIEKDAKNYALVGGGVGVAPLYFIASELINNGKNCFFLAGFKDSTFYAWERDLIKILRNYKLFTEDGSMGETGTPVDYIRKNIKTFKKYRIITCGPRDMLKALQDIFHGKKIKVQAIMEEKMACGVGTCMGCVTKIKNNNGGFEYKKVCSDGPVFDLLEVVFD